MNKNAIIIVLVCLLITALGFSIFQNLQMQNKMRGYEEQLQLIASNNQLLESKVAANAFCGNGNCEDKENIDNCAQDCVKNYCDIACQEQGYQISDCSLGEVTFGECCCAGGRTICGNGKCEYGETAGNCASDCGEKIICGNGECENGETADNCSKDCGCLQENEGMFSAYESVNKCCEGLSQKSMAGGYYVCIK